MVIGRVRLKRDASVWFGSVLRGDNEWIEVGERSQIQDNATLHTDPGFPLVIGDELRHRPQRRAARLHHRPNSLIGMGAVAAQRRQDRKQLPGRRRRAGDRGQEFPDNSLIVGSPARAVRSLDDEGRANDHRRRRHLRAALAAICGGAEADRIVNRRSAQKRCGRLRGESRPRANPVWGRGGVGT